MTIIEQNWLTAQSTRRYPLDDNATGTGDDGTRIKDDIILDLHIRFPAAAGQYAFLAGLTVTDTVVTAVFLACDENFTVPSFTPLCAVTVQQPVSRHRFYNLEALYPGVGGFSQNPKTPIWLLAPCIELIEYKRVENNGKQAT